MDVNANFSITVVIDILLLFMNIRHLDLPNKPLNCGVQSLVFPNMDVNANSSIPAVLNILLLLFMNIRHLEFNYKLPSLESEGFRNNQRIDIIRYCVTCCKR